MASTDSSTPSPSPHAVSSLLPSLVIAFSLPTRVFNQTIIVIPNYTKLGCPPASKVSIKAMESVGISDCGGAGDHCVVCLEEWRAGDVARVMPCSHRFHGDCIEKWLGVHGSCPVCRYEMPPEEEDEGTKREGEGRGSGGRAWVLSLNFGGIFGGQGDSGESVEDADADFSAATDTEEE